MVSLGAVRRLAILMTLVSLCADRCPAQLLTGIVQNGGTGKPVAGDPVILIGSGGVEETRTLSAAEGTFQFQGTPTGSSAEAIVVRVIHNGVSYDQQTKFGSAVRATVYDSSGQVNGLHGLLGILQFQTQRETLDVTELYAIRNDSKPPLTKVGPHNFDLVLPQDAQVRLVTVAGPGDEPLKLPISQVCGTASHCEIDFPIKPGLTKYSITYELPYGVNILFRRRVQYPMNQISVILPASMRFTSLGAHSFHRMGEQLGAQVETLTGINQNEELAFELSGTGALSHTFRPLDPSEKPVQVAKSSPALRAEPRPQVEPLTAQVRRPEHRQEKSAAPNTPLSFAMRAHDMGGWVSLAVALAFLGAVILWLVYSRRNRIV
jgi:hypothetical protein